MSTVAEDSSESVISGELVLVKQDNPRLICLAACTSRSTPSLTLVLSADEASPLPKTVCAMSKAMEAKEDLFANMLSAVRRFSDAETAS